MTIRSRIASVALLVVSTYLTLLVAELVVERIDHPDHFDRIRARATSAGRPFDSRPQRQVVQDLRASGVDAYPFFNAKDIGLAMRLLGQADTVLVPISGLGGVTTVNCNESGRWATYVSDRHGFNNPDSVWTVSADAVILGDSFVMGQCVNQGQDIASRLRQRGMGVVNLGYAGNGPALVLATLREYARPLRPRIVIWTVFDNDLADVIGERTVPSVVRYRSGETAGWFQRADERNALLRGLLAPVVNGRIVLWKRSWRAGVRQAVTLGALRARVRDLRSAKMDDLAEGRRDLEAMLDEATDETASWGGRLVLLHLPSWEFVRGNPSATELIAAGLAQVARRNGLLYLDGRRLFRTSTGWRYFPQDSLVSTHYSAAGYDAVAQLVFEALGTAGGATTGVGRPTADPGEGR